jgi:hypothetical protein
MSSAFLAQLAADASIFLGDFGQPVTNGATSTTGILAIRERVTADPSGFQTVRRQQSVRVKTGALGTVTDGETILTIGGAKYRVEYSELVAPDGVFTDHWLAGGVA